jgi:4-diphosphocytidyl-2-C-methyl-D-erythritol kinase
MQKTYGLKGGVFVDLYKTIPIAAGLAGGSADAAVTIKAMNRLYNLKLSLEEMKKIGAKFGSDIPYCIVEGTVLAEGVGDQLTYLHNFPECYIVLIKPTFSISTAEVYKSINVDHITKRPDTAHMIEAIEKGDLQDIGKSLCNVLETVTGKAYSEIDVIKKQLIEYGALGALMSGSGSSVFGIYDNETKAKKAAAELKKEKGISFVYVTTIYNRKKRRD